MDKRLKILISAYACNPLAPADSYPGEDIVGWNLVKELSKFHQLIVITRTYNKTNVEEALSTDTLKKIEFQYIKLPKFLKILRKNYFGIRIYYWLWQINAYFEAQRLNKKQKFDIAHQITFNNDWMPSYIGAYFNIPFIWGPAGGGQKVPQAFACELSLKNKFKETTRSVFQEFWRLTPTRIIGIKKAKAVLVCNVETKEKVKKFTKNIFDFPVNGISKEDLIPEGNSAKSQPQNPKSSLKSSSPKFKVLYAGRFDPIKAIPLAVRAFAKFNKKHPDSIFEIIGDGPEKGRISREIEKIGIQKSINMISWLSRKELVKRMREANVFLFPSLRDGGGAVVVEAMASGLPVVCLDLAGPGFHIQDKWGIKIEAKNPEYVVIEMAKALEKLYLDNNLRKQMSINARRRAKEYYSWDKLGERLQKIYKEALGKGNRKIEK